MLRQAFSRSLRGGYARVHARTPLAQTAQFRRDFAIKSGPDSSESFLSGSMSVYADEMYRVWRQNPESVHASWATYFENLEAGLPPGTAYQPAPGLQTQMATSAAPVSSSSGSHQMTNIVHLIRAFQIKGHQATFLDPLDIRNKKVSDFPDLDYRTYGFTEADLDKTVEMDGFTGITGYIGTKGTVTLRELLADLESSYCGTIGIEYMHIADREKCNFIRERFEIPNAASKMLSREEKLQCLERVTFAERFETYLAKKWNTAKRFGLEGCESLIPGLKSLVDRSTLLGVESVVIGMPHRGRLNVLSNVVRKPFELVFTEFAGKRINPVNYDFQLNEEHDASGDVKYHMGTSFDRTYDDGRSVHLSLLANPSHLEAVDPVVIGKARAKQFYAGDETGEKVLPILMHGDAAFCGQGVVYETMQIENLPNYGVGGTIHVVVNNQIGFTTDLEQSRATRYPTDLGKAFDSPIFHVNADDPEAVCYAFKMAAEYRQKFRSNVIIDVVGYRRYGHNEVDNPTFTNPLMYAKVAKHTPVMQKYQQECVKNGICDQAHVDSVNNHVIGVLEAAYDNSQKMDPPNPADWFRDQWTGFKDHKTMSPIRNTGVDVEVLKEIGSKVWNPPEGFKVHRQVNKILEGKRNAIEKGSGLDWGAGEALAFGSLVKEGYHVRLSGQDVERGTFSHRHAVVHDQNNGEHFVGLQNISADQAQFHVNNSPLSEFGVMGFELGYSLENPNALVMWEAQFGDFVNGAQTIIDQFLSSGEAKWYRQSGLVLLLPHGYDGQGPEHSSCRIERFLTMSDEDPDVVPDMDPETRRQVQVSNWQVANCTTPAQIFHVLRRQVHRDFRKPLILATPKWLLKHKDCVSDIEEFGPDKSFQRLIPEVAQPVLDQDPESVKKLIFCVGKVYYELEKARRELLPEEEWSKIAICRIEQITPFPFDEVAAQVKQYPNAAKIFVQEEPKNMGTWYFVDDRIYTANRVLNNMKDNCRCHYVGRNTMASPAVGFGEVHKIEQQRLVERAILGKFE